MRANRAGIWAGDELSVSQSPLVRHRAKPPQHQLHTTTCGGSMRVSAADSACDVSARAGAEDGQFACAVATAVRAESPRGRQTASATHMTSCIQLEYVASLIGARSRRLVAASATPAAVSESALRTGNSHALWPLPCELSHHAGARRPRRIETRATALHLDVLGARSQLPDHRLRAQGR